MRERTAMFAAGCFWGVEEAFRRLAGVVATEVGYAGGTTGHPTYEEVCTGRTGHAETVRVVYDAERVGYDELLDLFWSIHDPTQRDRQGPDIGTQYRSAVFFLDAEQEAAARASRERLAAAGRFRQPILTEITPAPPFWRAEEYHQRYLARCGGGCAASGRPPLEGEAT